MPDFHSVCRVADLPEGKSRAFKIGDKLVAVFCQSGEHFAIDDVCPHMGASLTDGEVEGGIVTCPWHGWRFRLADGVWADSPRVKIGCYATRVCDGMVQVSLTSPSPE
jgi:nitrite reductase (NADH) small subunit/3-phenylpropionate/trans-cinnamate dioxygenase ferredoxin subunit